MIASEPQDGRNYDLQVHGEEHHQGDHIPPSTHRILQLEICCKEQLEILVDAARIIQALRKLIQVNKFLGLLFGLYLFFSLCE
jgi:hypothetical protein